MLQRLGQDPILDPEAADDPGKARPRVSRVGHPHAISGLNRHPFKRQ